MLKNAYFLAKIGADIAENERNFAENSRLPRDLQHRNEQAEAAASGTRSGACRESNLAPLSFATRSSTAKSSTFRHQTAHSHHLGILGNEPNGSAILASSTGGSALSAGTRSRCPGPGSSRACISYLRCFVDFFPLDGDGGHSSASLPAL